LFRPGNPAPAGPRNGVVAEVTAENSSHMTRSTAAIFW
jgi:hypothetical protein